MCSSVYTNTVRTYLFCAGLSGHEPEGCSRLLHDVRKRYLLAWMASVVSLLLYQLRQPLQRGCVVCSGHTCPMINQQQIKTTSSSYSCLILPTVGLSRGVAIIPMISNRTVTSSTWPRCTATETMKINPRRTWNENMIALVSNPFGICTSKKYKITNNTVKRGIVCDYG